VQTEAAGEMTVSVTDAEFDNTHLEVGQSVGLAWTEDAVHALAAG